MAEQLESQEASLKARENQTQSKQNKNLHILNIYLFYIYF